VTTFAGPRDDGFYMDLGSVFDLLSGQTAFSPFNRLPRFLDNDGGSSDGLGQDGAGVDGLKGYNVLAIAIQVPLNQLPSFPYTEAITGNAVQGVGVYASASRQRITLRRSNGRPVNSGPWIQVSRMGNPLFNEVFVPLADKDRYNRTSPLRDAALFDGYARSPELAGHFNAFFGTAFATTGRGDLAALYIPDVIRVNTTTGPPLLPGQAGFSRLSFVGGDRTGVSPGGWPNGRRIGDDVVDIALTALASGPGYSPVVLLGDNVAANDQLYHQVFPYLGTPHSGAVHDENCVSPGP
jgi:hypothetical protein